MDQKLHMKLEFPPATLKRLERLKQLGGHSTYLDTLRAALKVYEVSLIAEQRGDHVVIEASQAWPTKAN